jgi:hypothetical protein
MKRRSLLAGGLLNLAGIGCGVARAEAEQATLPILDDSVWKIPARIHDAVQGVAKRMGWQVADPLFGRLSLQSWEFGRQQTKWEIACSYARSKDVVRLEVDALTGAIIRISDDRGREAARRALAAGETFRVKRDKALDIIRSLTREVNDADEEWLVTSERLHVPAPETRSYSEPEWQFHLHRSVQGYLSLADRIYSVVGPYDGSVRYWSRRFPKEYMPPCKPALSLEEAMRIAESLAGRDVRLALTKIGAAETNGLLWAPLAPGVPYNRLAYLFHVLSEANEPPERRRFALFISVDAITGEVGSLQERPMPQYSDAGWTERTRKSFHPRGALLSGIQEPEMGEARQTLSREIAFGKGERAAKPSDRMLRFQEGGHDYALDTISGIFLWKNRTSVWGKATEPSDHWLSLRLSEGQMMTLLHWLSTQGKSLSQGR